MQKAIRTDGLNSILVAGFLLLTGAFQQLCAQDLTGHQTVPEHRNIQFTRDAGLAYLEALEFCLTQIGSPIRFDEPVRVNMLNELNRNFYTLPLDTQVKLSQARAIWNQYKAAWNYLSMEQKTAFAFDVFALAFGAQAASQALGLAPADSSGDDADVPFEDAKDEFCTSPDVLAMGGCP